jgi:thioredoxin
MASTLQSLTQQELMELSKTNDIVLVDFWAPWCGPCLMMNPILEKVATMPQMKDIKFVKINVDENPEIAEKLDIQGIPNFKVFEFSGVEGQYKILGSIEGSRSNGLDFMQEILKIVATKSEVTK